MREAACLEGELPACCCPTFLLLLQLSSLRTRVRFLKFPSLSSPQVSVPTVSSLLLPPFHLVTMNSTINIFNDVVKFSAERVVPAVQGTAKHLGAQAGPAIQETVHYLGKHVAPTARITFYYVRQNTALAKKWVVNCLAEDVGPAIAATLQQIDKHVGPAARGAVIYVYENVSPTYNVMMGKINEHVIPYARDVAYPQIASYASVVSSSLAAGTHQVLTTLHLEDQARRAAEKALELSQKLWELFAAYMLGWISEYPMIAISLFLITMSIALRAISIVPVLRLVGFGRPGPDGQSYASQAQSKKGNAVKGSMFADSQSLAMGGRKGKKAWRERMETLSRRGLTVGLFIGIAGLAAEWKQGMLDKDMGTFL
jgi:hypothetical protein